MTVKVLINKKSIQDKVKSSEKKIVQLIFDEKNIKRLSLIITRYIKGKIRLGQKVTGGKQRDISEAGRKNRKKISETDGRGASFNSKYKGNLTITGNFLESLAVEVEKNKLTIGYRGDHKPYTDQLKTITNQKLQEYLESMGFETIGLSNDLINQIKKEIILLIVRNYKKL